MYSTGQKLRAVKNVLTEHVSMIHVRQTSQL
jgi:hypothetical protein